MDVKSEEKNMIEDMKMIYGKFTFIKGKYKRKQYGQNTRMLKIMFNRDTDIVTLRGEKGCDVQHTVSCNEFKMEEFFFPCKESMIGKKYMLEKKNCDKVKECKKEGKEYVVEYE
jgi:hypothetical protein